MVARHASYDVGVKTAAVAARDIEPGMGQSLLYLFQITVLLDESLNAQAVDMHLLFLQSCRHLSLS